MIIKLSLIKILNFSDLIFFEGLNKDGLKWGRGS